MAQTQTILVVDDDPDIRELFNDFLSKHGFSVTEASNGAEALDQLEHAPPPALIFLDLNMPVMNGYRFYARMRERPQLSNIPVVISSCESFGLDIADAMGAAGYVYKLRSFDAVIDIIARISTKK